MFDLPKTLAKTDSLLATEMSAISNHIWNVVFMQWIKLQNLGKRILDSLIPKLKMYLSSRGQRVFWMAAPSTYAYTHCFHAFKQSTCNTSKRSICVKYQTQLNAKDTTPGWRHTLVVNTRLRSLMEEPMEASCWFICDWMSISSDGLLDMPGLTSGSSASGIDLALKRPCPSSPASATHRNEL